MDNTEKIEKLRIGIMCAVIHMFHTTHSQEIVNVFSSEELDEIAGKTDHLKDARLEGVFKDLLDMTKPDEVEEDETD